jgi:hypothetical protein
MNGFINYLNQIVELPDACAVAINEITVFQSLPKHTSLLQTAMYV